MGEDWIDDYAEDLGMDPEAAHAWLEELEELGASDGYL